MTATPHNIDSHWDRPNEKAEPFPRPLRDPSFQQLEQDNARLRAIVAELLIKNQILRWELEGQSAADVSAGFEKPQPASWG